MIGIYAIRNKITGAVYIGSSADIPARLQRHRGQLRLGVHKNSRLQRAWTKYGEDAFGFDVVEVVDDRQNLLRIEQAYIDRTKKKYNLIPAGAVPSFAGGSHSPETRALISAKLRGKRRTEAVKQHLRELHTGMKSRPESVEKMRAKLTGLKRSPEAIARYRAAWTPERRAAQSRVAAESNRRRSRR